MTRLPGPHRRSQGERAFVMALALLTVWGCSDPEEVAEQARRALQAHDLPALQRIIHTDYADPLGNRAQLFSDLEELFRGSARLAVTFEDVFSPPKVTGGRAAVVGTIDAELTGEPGWRLLGPLALDLEREDDLRIRSGLLANLRDVRALAQARRAALEGNDAQAMAALLHPAYEDGPLDKARAVERLTKDLEGVRIRFEPIHYRLEVRGSYAHLDERYRLNVNHKSQPPSVARLTLKRSAGRWRITGGLYPATRAP